MNINNQGGWVHTLTVTGLKNNVPLENGQTKDYVLTIPELTEADKVDFIRLEVDPEFGYWNNHEIKFIIIAYLGSPFYGKSNATLNFNREGEFYRNFDKCEVGNPQNVPTYCRPLLPIGWVSIMDVVGTTILARS